MTDTPKNNADDYRCPICAEPLKASDICASDITEGTCHAECLAGSPVVDLDTGDEIPGCKIDTYPYREVMEPPAAYRCDTCGAHIVAGACDCTKMQRPVLIGNDKPAPKDNMAVKPLAWKTKRGTSDIFAETPVGTYGVGLVHMKMIATVRHIVRDQWTDTVIARGGLEEVKLAAYRHYEDAILSAIQTSPKTRAVGS